MAGKGPEAGANKEKVTKYQEDIDFTTKVTLKLHLYAKRLDQIF